MKRSWFTIGVLFFFLGAAAQPFTEKRYTLPEKLNSGFSPGDNLLPSPDGTLLCIMKKNSPYNALLMNLATGIIEDSIKIDSYAPMIKWSPDSRRLCFYVSGYPDSYFALYDRKGNLLKKIDTPYPVLNYQLDSTAAEIAATLYNLPETGTDYSTDLSSAYIYPKGKKYTYRVYSFDVAGGKIKDSISVNATYPRIEGKWKDNWLLLLCQSEAEFQINTTLCRVDFKNRQLTTIANSEKLFINENLGRIQTYFTGDLFVSGDRTVFEFSEKENRFTQVISMPMMRVQFIEGTGANPGLHSANVLAIGASGQRRAENELWLYNIDKKWRKIDTKDFIPQAVTLTDDSVSLLNFTNEELVLRKYPTKDEPARQRPEVMVQNSIKADTRLLVPGTDFLLEYNAEEWQVTDQSSQLIVHRQRDVESYGTKFTTLGNSPYVIRYGSDKAELIPTGKWKEVVATLSLQHPLLKEGNSAYSSIPGLSNLSFNPATSLLTGLFNSSNFYFVAAWDLRSSYAPEYVLKIERKDIPGDIKSLYSSGGAVPIMLTHIIYNLQEADWKKVSPEEVIKKIKQLTGSLSSFTIEKLNEFNDFSWKYNVAAGKVTGNFSYQDSIYGQLLINLKEPSRSVYFCHKPLKGTFPGYKFVQFLPGQYGITQIQLSDKGNFVALSDLGNVSLCDLATMKNQAIPKENKEANFDGDTHFLEEDKGILVNNSAWYDATNLRPVHPKASTLFCDSATYLPGKKLFLVNLPGRKGYLEIQLDRMRIQQKKSTGEKLQESFIKDTTWRSFFPGKKNWIIAGRWGIGYDSSQKATIGYMGRSFGTTLNGSINFVQFLPLQNQVLIGNTREGSFECWDVIAEEMLFKLVLIDETNFFIQSRSGNYYATPNALQQLGFLQDGEAIPASFLDAGLNRPDIVLADMFDTADNHIRQLVGIYRKAAARKNSRAISIIPGVSPVVTIAPPAKTLQQESAYNVNYTVQGKANAVRYFSIQVNNVVVWDTSFAKPLTGRSLEKKIQLTSGENQLVYLAKDMAGNSSVPVFQRIVYQPVKPVESRTFVIAIGVNRYSDTARNLKYAVKDGKDLLTAFRSMEGEKVITDSLFDTAVTKENIRNLRQKLLQTGIEDKIVICFSGHGMLDDSMNFYLATADMDFTRPQKNGFAFSELEELLAGIPARKKLLLIDACHSGNIEKEETLSEEEKKTMAPQVTTQSDTTAAPKGLDVKKPADLSLQQVISQLFASSSSASGAEVIAATAGNAYAYEAPQWNNGVFTYAVLKAFNSNADLDKNFNKKISIKELKRFVYATVMDLTNGKQQPLSRYENPNYDWDLLPMRYD
ncbi:MAG: caspase family protein [Chitinophagaceae bacterium]